MDDLQEALTRYMVRRVSLRRVRERNRDLNSTNVDPQKTREPSTHREPSTSMDDDRNFDHTYYFSTKDSNYIQNSYKNNNHKKDNEKSLLPYDKCNRSIEKLPANCDSAFLIKPFELSNPKKCNDPSKNVVGIDQKSENFKKIEYDSTNNMRRMENEKFKKEPAKLLKIREYDQEIPSKMVAELKNFKIANNRSVFEKSSHDVSQSSITSLTEAIENLDTQIKNLEMKNVNTTFTATVQIENSSRIYPILDDVKLDSTGFTPRKNFRSQLNDGKIFESCKNHSSSNINDNYEGPPNKKIVISKKNRKKNEGNNPDNFLTRQNESSINNYLEAIIEAEKFDIKEKSRTDEKSASKRKPEDDLFYQETPRLSRKMPIMESTRKSLHSDSTKINFPTPTRVDPNSISTIGISPSPEISNSKHHGKSKNIEKVDALLSETIPYEVEHFLEDALGDEFLNSTNMTYATCEARDRTNSHFTASELMSHDRTPLHRRIMQALRPPMTEPTHKNFNKLDRSMEMCRSFSQRIKKKFRSGLKTEENPPPVPPLPSESRQTDRIRELLQEVNVQQTLMNQATKALNLCNTMKEFTDSSERIESERLLLLSSIRKKYAVEEIKKITSNDNEQEKNVFSQRGEVTISDMSIDLNETIKCDIEEDEMIEWFVLIISQGSRVWATQPMNYCVKDTKISFPDKILITNLTPSFKIQIEVYTMKVRNTFFNHEDKYRIQNSRQRRSTSCPPCPSIIVSPTKLLKKIERPYLSPKIHYTHGTTRNKTTAFVNSGFVELFLHDLSLTSPWPLILVPANSILQGTIDMNLACRLHLSVSHEGFVNHGDEAGGLAIWNRRFCVLKGHTIMFWNYPDEQETKEPLKIIDLINCLSGKITTADRRICARPRTLLFETARPRISEDQSSIIFECKTACTIVRNLISLDSVNELMEWSTKLNQVITALREWNVIRAEKDLQVSDL